MSKLQFNQSTLENELSNKQIAGMESSSNEQKLKTCETVCAPSALMDIIMAGFVIAYLSTMSMHVRLFSQGLSWQISMLISHCAPSHPDAHSQSYLQHEGRSLLLAYKLLSRQVESNKANHWHI